MPIAYSPKISYSGLVGYWDAANTKSYPGSGTVWHDLIGNNNLVLSTGSIGTINSNIMTLSAADGNTITLSGATNMVQSSGSVSYWINKTSAGVVGSVFQIYEGSGDTTNYLRSYIDSGNNMDLIIEDDNIVKLNFQYDLDNLGSFAGNWYNIVWTQDGATVKLYINGVYINQTTNSWWTSHLTGTILVKVGCAAWAAFTGKISIFQIYNRALSQSEITQNFNAHRSRYNI